MDDRDMYAVEQVILQQVAEKRPLALRTLRLAIEQAQDRMQVAHRKGITPGITNVFTGVRIPLDYTKRPGGAYELLLWLAMLTHACLIVPEGKLSTVPLAVDPGVLRTLMRFIVTDIGVSIKPPFPYDQAGLRRAYEEWNVSQSK